jgi:hypothetical protein
LSSVICKSNARPSVQTGGHCHFFRRISPCRQTVDKGQIAAKIPDSLAGQTVRSGVAQRRAPCRRFALGAQNTRHHVKAADQRIVLQGAALILFGPLRRLSNSPLGCLLAALCAAALFEPLPSCKQKEKPVHNVYWFFLVRWKGLEPPAY